MVDFTWTNAAGGDWSDAANWSPTITGPPGAGDNANFGDLATAYTVTVQAGTTVGLGPDGGPFISIDAVSAGNGVAFVIDGSLRADFIYNTNAGRPATSLTIAAGGALIVPNLFYSTNVFQTVTISGMNAGGYLELGDLTVGGVLSGKNQLMIFDFANTDPMTLNTGVIQFDDVGDLSIHASQTITNVAWGNEFVFQGADFTGHTVSFDSVTNDLTVMDGLTTVFTMDNVFLQSGFTGDFTIVNGNTIEAICYLRGTHILTPTGEVCVEGLKIGDLVVTRFGAIQPIKWIGRQSYDARFIKTDRRQIPVCIRAGALGDRQPARDLFVSPGHSMLIDGYLVLARFLVNGVTITQEWSPEDIHYFQIELETHDCVIAEGVWSETYADGPGLRNRFHNVAEFVARYPDHGPPDEITLCAPRPERGAKLDKVLRSVVERASAGLRPGPLRGAIDFVAAPWTIEGWANDVDHPELPVLLELLMDDQVIGTVLACSYRSDLLKAGIGAGRCAFFLTSPARLRPDSLATLRIRRATDHAEIPMTEACIARIAEDRDKSIASLSRLVA